MLETKEVTIDNKKFNIRQFPVLKSLKLENKTLKIISPILGSIQSIVDVLSFQNGVQINGDKEINVTSAVNALRECFEKLDSDDFISYIRDMISSTACYLENGSIVDLRNEDALDVALSGDNLLVYKLLFEIMKINGFCSLKLMGSVDGILDGIKTTITGSSKGQKLNKKK